MPELRTLTKIALPLVATLGLMGALAGCGSSTASDTSSTVATAMTSAAATASTSAAVASDAVTITISNFAYSPATVNAGQTVSVTNDDDADHTLTIAEAGIDVTVPAHGTASFTAPAKAGSYTVTCDFHPTMAGTLVVT